MEREKETFRVRHQELWKLIKFLFAGFFSTVIEWGVYYLLQNVAFASLNTQPFRIWIFEYEGIGYLWSFLISTAIGYAIAFVLNRKITFRSNANPVRSVVLYVLMVVFTILVTTWLGTAILNLCIQNNLRGWGEALAKPLVSLLAFVWTYPINRFLIHPSRRATPEN